jgi:folate-binding protein YgfZ
MNVVPRETLLVAGHTVALAYDDPSREYAALRDAVGVIRRDERPRWVFAGPKAAETLGGLVTNDVETLQPGTGCYAVALTAKGRIIADVRVLRRETDLLVDVGSRAATGWGEMVRKYVNPRLAKYADVSDTTGCVGLYGPRAQAMLARVSAASPWLSTNIPAYHHAAITIGGRAARVIRSPDFGLNGFDIVADTSDCDAIFQMFLDAGARAVGLAAADIARVEAGRPEWGIDMDDATIPQEANLDDLHAISYTKGCYTGQEVVARVHFRGHVNRMLRGLIATDPLQPRATVISTARAEVGDVRSSVVSPRVGPIALAMIRREIGEGDEVIVRDPSGAHEHPARVVGLPF